MMETKNAPPVAAVERACDVVLSKHVNIDQRVLRQGAKRRNRDAAVIVADHPDADRCARLVPDGAQVMKLGGAVAGYFKANRSRYVLRSCRAHEIERLFLHRHPASEGVLPLPEDEVIFARALVAHANPQDARAQLIRWRVEITTEVGKVLCDPKAWARRFKAEALGDLLGLTEDERDRLGITTFRAAGQSAADQDEARRAKDRERKRAERARQACGTMKPISAQKRRPWDAAGMSRSKWYARGFNKRDAEKVAVGWTAPVRSKVREEFASDKSSPRTATLIVRALTEPQSLDQLIEVTGLPRERIKSALSRLKTAAKVRRVRRGVWQAITTTATGGHRAAAKKRPVPRATIAPPITLSTSPSPIHRVASALLSIIDGAPKWRSDGEYLLTNEMAKHVAWRGT